MNKFTLPLLGRAPSLRDMMRTKVTSLLTTGLTLFVLAPTAFSQEDAGFTAVEKSAEGLQEAILMTASKLVQVYGGDAVGPGTLTFNGIFTDGSWQADFSGDYAGEPVALDFTGTYDDSKNAGAFTVTGTYGSATWDGDGAWRYDIVDPQTIHMFWDSAASIINGIGRLFKPDKHFTTPKKWARSQLPGGGWHVVDYGEYRTTYFGIPVGPIKKEISDWVYPPGGGRRGIAVTASLPDDGIQLSGSADFDVGTFTGMVNLTPVPEAKSEGGVDSGPDAYSSAGPKPDGKNAGEECYDISNDLEDDSGEPAEPSGQVAPAFALGAALAPTWCEYRATGNGTGCPLNNDNNEIKFCIAQNGGSCEMPTGVSKWSIKGKDCTFAQIAYIDSPGACPRDAKKYNFKWSGKKIEACK